MRKDIKVGDKIKLLVPEERKFISYPVEGVVYKMTYNESLKAYSIYVKPFDKYGLSVITTAFPIYGDSFEFLGMVYPEELEKIQAKMLPFAGPKTAKKTVKRGGIVIREDALLTPNTDYSGKKLEGYVSTKKHWFEINRTTAKMVFFTCGGKCSINNVTEVR